MLFRMTHIFEIAYDLSALLGELIFSNLFFLCGMNVNEFILWENYHKFCFFFLFTKLKYQIDAVILIQHLWS